jgi:hypothetical protein
MTLTHKEFSRTLKPVFTGVPQGRMRSVKVSAPDDLSSLIPVDLQRHHQAFVDARINGRLAQTLSQADIKEILPEAPLGERIRMHRALSSAAAVLSASRESDDTAGWDVTYTREDARDKADASHSTMGLVSALLAGFQLQVRSASRLRLRARSVPRLPHPR